MQISTKYYTTVTPAGYAFSIWGLIWFTQLAAVIWLLIRTNDDTAVCSLSYSLVCSIHVSSFSIRLL